MSSEFTATAITSKGDRIFNAVNVILLGVLGIITFFPLYYVFVVSFSDPSTYLSSEFQLLPVKWSLASYKYLMSTDAFLHAIGNSVFLAIVGTALSLLVTSCLSYAISRKRLQGRKFIMLLILLTTLFNPGLSPHIC